MHNFHNLKNKYKCIVISYNRPLWTISYVNTRQSTVNRNRLIYICVPALYKWSSIHISFKWYKSDPPSHKSTLGYKVLHNFLWVFPEEFCYFSKFFLQNHSYLLTWVYMLPLPTQELITDNLHMFKLFTFRVD